MIRIVYEFPENVQQIKECLDRFIQIGLLEWKFCHIGTLPAVNLAPLSCYTLSLIC
jgi:hypothetical protein